VISALRVVDAAVTYLRRRPSVPCYLTSVAPPPLATEFRPVHYKYYGIGIKLKQCVVDAIWRMLVSLAQVGPV
jgi:hypothetical protein